MTTNTLNVSTNGRKLYSNDLMTRNENFLAWLFHWRRLKTSLYVSHKSIFLAFVNQRFDTEHIYEHSQSCRHVTITILVKDTNKVLTGLSLTGRCCVEIVWHLNIVPAITSCLVTSPALDITGGYLINLVLVVIKHITDCFVNWVQVMSSCERSPILSRNQTTKTRAECVFMQGP